MDHVFLMTEFDCSKIPNTTGALVAEKSIDDLPNEVVLRLLQLIDKWKDIKSFVASSIRIGNIYEKNKHIIVPREVLKVTITSGDCARIEKDFRMSLTVEYLNTFHTTYRLARLEKYIPFPNHKTKDEYELCLPDEKIIVRQKWPQKRVTVYTNSPFHSVIQRVAYVSMRTKIIQHFTLEQLYLSKQSSDEFAEVFEANQLKALNVVHRNCFYGIGRNRFYRILAAYQAERFTLCRGHFNFVGSRIGTDPGVDNLFIKTVSKMTKFVWKELIGLYCGENYFRDDVEGDIPVMDDRYMPFDNDFICNCKASTFDVGRLRTQITLDGGITQILQAWSNGTRKIEFIKLTLAGLSIFDEVPQLLEKDDPRLMSFYNSLNIQPFKGYRQIKSSDGKRFLYMQINNVGIITISKSPFY